ncbi:MAG: hypothetical protein WAV05_09265 [Anaerolineales bacterium]
MHHPRVAGEIPTGYAFDEIDVRDVKALCQRFGIEIPEEYQKFNKRFVDWGERFVQNPIRYFFVKIGR